jgi:hypothetical protein
MGTTPIDQQSEYRRFTTDEEYRRAELIRALEHSLQQLSLPELESVYYDMVSKDYIR